MPQEKRDIFDETASKLLVQALLADNETETIAAIGGLRRYVQREGLSPHDIKTFFASGTTSSWMQSIMSLVERDRNHRVQAEEAASRYRNRLALLETAIRRFRSILRDISSSDTKDAMLQFRMETTRVNDSDKPGDPADKEMTEFLSRIPQ